LIAEKGLGGEVTLGEIINGVVNEIGVFDKTEFSAPEYVINIALLKNIDNGRLIQKINSCSRPLSDYTEIKAALKAYEVGKGKPKQTEKMKRERIYHSLEQLDSTYRKYLEGKDVKRFHSHWSGQWLKYGSALAAPRDSDLFQGERILVRQIPSRPPYSINGWLVNGDYVNDINSMIVRGFKKVDPRFILGVLNSKLITFWFINTFDKFQRKTFPQFKVNELATFPIIDASSAQQENVVKLVDIIQQSYDHLTNVKEGTARYTEINKHLDELDLSLDKLIYEIAGLSEAEILIIENSTSGKN
jgi:hypothetical protein